MSLSKELYQNPSSEETAEIIKTGIELTTSSFATISGIKGMQFGKEVFSSVLKFKDLHKFLSVFEDVQRSVSPRRVSQIKTYIMSKIENDDLMRFFSAMTVTIRSNAFYDEPNKQVAIDIGKSRLSINDGQHRHYAIIKVLEEYQTKMNKAKNQDDFERYKKIIEELENMVIPIVIFSGMSVEEEKQLFSDLNGLAQRPSRNANIRLSQTDILSRLAREVAENNEYLIRYGVEFEKNSIHKNNPKFILLTTVYNYIKVLYIKDLKLNNNYINSGNYTSIFENANNSLNEIFESLPKDLHIKGKYVLAKNFAFRGIASFLSEMNYNSSDEEERKKLVKAISKVRWESDYNYWNRYDASLTKTGLVVFPSNGEGGVSSIKQACLDEYRKIR